MDLLLDVLDPWILTPYVYPDTWLPSDPWRQALTLLAILNIGGEIMYLSFAGFSYLFIYDHRLLKHPLLLKVSARHRRR